MFVEQHSMKINQGAFYTLESKRMKYMSASEQCPYIGGVLAVIYFVGFAIKTPLHNKLYKEVFYSLGLGMLTAIAYPYYYRRHYLKNIDEIYWYLQAAFEKHPEMKKVE